MPDKPPTSERIEELIFGSGALRRYTQDSPVLPDVWNAYFEQPEEPQDLLLTPHLKFTPGELARTLQKILREEKDKHVRLPISRWERARRRENRPLVYNESHVVVALWFDEMVRIALPLTNWWWNYVWKAPGKEGHIPSKIIESGDERLVNQLKEQLGAEKPMLVSGEHRDDLLWLVRILGELAWPYYQQGLQAKTPREETRKQLAAEEQVRSALWLLEGLDLAEKPEKMPLWSLNLNRQAKVAIKRSVVAVKADSARRLFKASGKDLIWAVVDSGIDAKHPAFCERDADGKPCGSRVVATYDFTRIRSLLAADSAETEEIDFSPDVRRRAKELRSALKSGRTLDWSVLEPSLRVPHDNYRRPKNPHGTHVAGILAADWKKSDSPPPDDEEPLEGMCPDLRLYDLRVLGDDGSGDEFGIIAALQFVRYLNSTRDKQLIHGVNLSLAIPHKVASFACGRTPVCEECERLMSNGVVVVAAAGNSGYTGGAASLGTGFQDISITDPGNAEAVITVGATHRYMPHTYGVSYFSSRGPTADGRRKPDLVAPGEKIKSVIPGDRAATLDGTSMAAPHVSGAAALLLAQYTELIGQPARVKQILCQSATDLGRERDFQGHGMLDILRALQSI
ncbi:MAG: S8 family peptidase [Candidatus Acidiferrales bacterium]